ncbi:MAG: hypothetical protein ABIO74_05670 [Dokdonella sp.]
MTARHHHSQDAAQLDRGRKAARRTALLLASIAVAVYGGFLVLGVLGR